MRSKATLFGYKATIVAEAMIELPNVGWGDPVRARVPLSFEFSGLGRPVLAMDLDPLLDAMMRGELEGRLR